jgi:selenide,water dikinase
MSATTPPPPPIRLTATAKAAGCAAKLSPSVLDAALKKLPIQHDPNRLVGFETADDAAIYRLSPEIAIVQTVDFFTPIVDDPFEFGQVAATNALSDVYAMGGRPVSSLTILAFPANGDPAVLEQILSGGLSKMSEANCTVVGGHSIRDDEIKFGYAVTGVVHPEKFWKNVGALAGDVLILTKAIGTGVIATALKQEKAQPAWVAAATASMTTLNRAAADALHEIEDAATSAANDARATPIHAVTDVTGFGLLGHAREVAIGSRVSLSLDHTKIAYLPGAIDASRAKFFSGGMANNRDFVESCTGFAPTVPDEFRALLFDPQTAGGLLISIAPSHADATLTAMQARHIDARIIGHATEKSAHLLNIV